MTTPIRTSGVFRPTPTKSPSAFTSDGFLFTLWTNDATLASLADRAGVERIGVDLERLGKSERQAGRGTWISPHTEEDLVRVADVLKRAALFVRTNPLHSGSVEEVERVLAAGARVLMLPMVSSAEEARSFVRMVSGRARVVLLIERHEALDAAAELALVPGVDEAHIGLNDLAISLGLPNRWLALADERIDIAARSARAAGLRFGLGGIGRAHDASLPIPSDLVYAEYARTGATAALLSRSFHGTSRDLAAEVDRARMRLACWRTCSAGELNRAHRELIRRAATAVVW